MHKYYSLIISIIAILLYGCASKKSAVILPCETESVDDALYIRELGHGVSTNLQFARRISINDAQFKIFNRLCDSIRTYLPQVNYDSAKDSIFVGLSDTILFRYSTSFFGELSYTRKECEKVTSDANNRYHCFITLSLPKEDIEHANYKVFLDYMNYTTKVTNSKIEE